MISQRQGKQHRESKYGQHDSLHEYLLSWSLGHRFSRFLKHQTIIHIGITPSLVVNIDLVRHATFRNASSGIRAHPGNLNR